MFSPKALSRREVLHTAGLLGISAAATSTALAGAETPTGLAMLKESGLVTGKIKPLKYGEIPGLLTKEQVTPHYQAHYGGAFKRFTTMSNNSTGSTKGKKSWAAMR